jgi:hypothetical protein
MMNRITRVRDSIKQKYKLLNSEDIMHYRIRARLIESGQPSIRAWYAGRTAAGPRFEAEAMNAKVLRYFHLTNAKDDQAYLARLTDLCHDVEIVTFDEDGRVSNQNTEETSHAATVELDDLTALDILEDVQEILTRMITPGIHAQSDTNVAHEQVRTALSLLLRAVSILRKAE